jgi:hypothetical protein
MAVYLKRLAELLLVTFTGAALPVLVSAGFNKAALAGAASAGLAAVYALVTKRVGDAEKPGAVK